MTQATSKMFVGPQNTFCTLCLAWIYCLYFPLSMAYTVKVSARTLPAQAPQRDQGKSIDFFEYVLSVVISIFCKKEIKMVLIGHTGCRYFSYFTVSSFTL